MTLMKTPPKPATISVAVLAKRLGCSKGTAYNYLNAGLIPGAWRIAPAKAWHIPADAGL